MRGEAPGPESARRPVVSRLLRRLLGPALALVPSAALLWAAWLSYWAHAWRVAPWGIAGADPGLVRYFLLLSLAALAGGGLATGLKGWGTVPWLVLGLPLLAGLSFISPPPVGYGGQILAFATRWGLAFFGLGLALSLAVGLSGQGRAGMRLRAALALASLTVFLAVLGTGAWRALAPVEQLSSVHLKVWRGQVGYRPGVPWAVTLRSGRVVFLTNSAGDLLEVRAGGGRWLVRHGGLLPAPSLPEVEAALGLGWTLQQPPVFLFRGARDCALARPAETGPGCVQVVYELQAVKPLTTGGWAGAGLPVMARLNLERFRALSCRVLSLEEAAAWEAPAGAKARAGPFSVASQGNYTVEIRGPGVHTRIHSYRSAVWSWVWAEDRLALAASENGELVAATLPPWNPSAVDPQP
ncbi:MAG: hypothetical protein K6T75_08205 [Acetobacteraceae bacterium]|nr:hypothetical protein [Acetobacteraceae bacterium]